MNYILTANFCHSKYYQMILKFQEVIYNKFKKRKKSTPTKVLEVRECAPGDELTRELEDAWILYTKVFILLVVSNIDVKF